MRPTGVPRQSQNLLRAKALPRTEERAEKDKDTLTPALRIRRLSEEKEKTASENPLASTMPGQVPEQFKKENFREGGGEKGLGRGKILHLLLILRFGGGK